jgi:ribosomal protein S18 acetylase RimI-like enzyme
VTVEVRLLGAGEARLLLTAEPDVFDKPVDRRHAEAFLADPRHHIVVAIEGGRVVGFVSAVDYLHPDKPRELFVNEVGVADRLHRRGIGARMMRAMLAHARTLGCEGAWCGTEVGNLAARGLYVAVGGVEDAPDTVIYSFPVG